MSDVYKNMVVSGFLVPLCEIFSLQCRSSQEERFFYG